MKKQSPEEKPKMKDCFGVSFGLFMEDMIGEPQQLQKCYECDDFDKCQKMSLVRVLTKLRFDVQRGASSISRALGNYRSTPTE